MDVFPVALIFALVAILISGLPSYAELRALSTDELKTSTAQAGFTDFTLNHNTARLFLDIHIETYGIIGGFSAGNYNSGSDQSWTGITLGQNIDNNLTIDGLVFIADFEEGSLGTSPVLERVIIGSNYLKGFISANISSFTGIYSSALTNGGSPDTVLNRANLSDIEFKFNSNEAKQEGLFFILNVDSSNPGIQIVAGYNEKNIPIGPTAGTPWWDSP